MTSPATVHPTQAVELLGREWDIVVAGGGNAAIVAAMEATDRGASVLMLERGPYHLRGGNTRHTRNIRCVRDASDGYSPDDYTYDQLWADLCSVGDGPVDEYIASITVRESETIPPWMTAHGARWQPPLTGTLHLGRTNRFFLGGGKALLNSYYRTAASLGIATLYEACVTSLEMDGRVCRAVTVDYGGQTHRVAAKAFVCAAGGFEANLEWLRRYWGDAVDNYIIRGTPLNDGMLLAHLLDLGALSAGQEKGFHAIALDSRAPKFDGGISTRLDTIPFGIVVNREGRRFSDEGEDIWPKRYAVWGRRIAETPGQQGFALWDAKVNGMFLPPMYGVTKGDSLGEVATQLGLDPAVVEQEVATYNAHVVPGTFDPTGLDDCHTDGLTPSKSHWAQRLDTPPYYGIAMSPGITFTYMGVAIDDTARIKLVEGGTFDNVFAAGEIMSGNVLSSGYMAGFGMTIGSVWGRTAAKGAASYVRG